MLANNFCGPATKSKGTPGPGARVAIAGRGWQWGVFASDVRQID
ncbi:hypothetical protein [Ensifer adhaerens]|nr:hypothetical protein [Ensifer adhaerens]